MPRVARRGRVTGSTRCFCSSVPNRKIGIVPSEVCAASVIATDESMRGELLDRDRVRQRVAARASELLGERDSHQTEVGHLRDELVREPRLAVDLLGDGCDPVDGEPADRLAEELVLGRKVEIHARRSYPELGDFSRRAAVNDRCAGHELRPALDWLDARDDRSQGHVGAVERSSRDRLRVGRRAGAAAVLHGQVRSQLHAHGRPDPRRADLVVGGAAAVRALVRPSRCPLAAARRPRARGGAGSASRPSRRATRCSLALVFVAGIGIAAFHPEGAKFAVFAERPEAREWHVACSTSAATSATRSGRSSSRRSSSGSASARAGCWRRSPS